MAHQRKTILYVTEYVLYVTQFMLKYWSSQKTPCKYQENIKNNRFKQKATTKK